jgi:DNA-binding FadR family transcriptional regulator
LHRVATRFNLAAWRRDRAAQRSIQEHRSIVSTLRQRDPEGAGVAMLAHITNARQRIMGVMETD